MVGNVGKTTGPRLLPSPTTHAVIWRNAEQKFQYCNNIITHQDSVRMVNDRILDDFTNLLNNLNLSTTNPNDISRNTQWACKHCELFQIEQVNMEMVSRFAQRELPRTRS